MYACVFSRRVAESGKGRSSCIVVYGFTDGLCTYNKSERRPHTTYGGGSAERDVCYLLL